MAASAAAGQFYNINGPNGSWIAKVIAISKEPFRSRCGQLLYRTPKRGELPFEDGPYIQVEWMASINDRIAGVNVCSRRPAGASHIRGVSELVASGKRYVIRASMLDFQVYVASAEHLILHPEIAIRGTCWLYYVAEGSNVSLDSQGMAIDALASCVIRVRSRIRLALANASTGDIKGFLIEGIAAEAWPQICNLFPQCAMPGKNRVKRAFDATSGEIGEIAGIRFRRYAVQSSTTCLSFIGDSELAQLVVLFGEDLYWNIRRANQRSLGLTENETVLLMKDASSSETQSSITFECRRPHGPSFLGVGLYIKINANFMVIPVNVTAEHVSNLLDPTWTDHAGTMDLETTAGVRSDENNRA